MTLKHEYEEIPKECPRILFLTFAENPLCARERSFVKREALSHFTDGETEAWGQGVFISVRSRNWVCLTPKHKLWSTASWLLHWYTGFSPIGNKNSSVTAHFLRGRTKNVSFFRQMILPVDEAWQIHLPCF